MNNKTERHPSAVRIARRLKSRLAIRKSAFADSEQSAKADFRLNSRDFSRRALRRAGARMALAAVVLTVTGAAVAQQIQSFTIGQVEYFGYSGLDLARIEKAIPLHAGETLSVAQMGSALSRASAVVRRLTGHPPTDIEPVCCTATGGWYVYVGLPGKSTGAVAYNPAPAGHAKLPAAIVALYDRTMNDLLHAVRTGAKEDDSKGYFLSADPGLAKDQLAMRAYAAAHTPDITAVLAASADPHQRQAAADALGYGAQSPAQIQALARAGRDPDAGVRNNAVRSLVVLARFSPQVAGEIPAQSLIDLIDSGSWTDRNKGCALIEVVSRFRGAKLLAALRRQAMPQLIEMARWDSGHAGAAELILGRIAGIPEQKLDQMVNTDQAGAIIHAASAR